MAEADGSGRLDRIEVNLERLTERFNAMIEHHDREFKQLMTWQVLMQDEVRKLAEDEAAYRKEQRERDRALYGRVSDVVSAIGDLIRRIPPENLR
jgi:Skp family chaperone for outer membrane proteins